jgi:hypothetical protein
MWEPFGPSATRLVTVPYCRQVLVLVPHLVAGTRLMDVLPLLAGDPRVQVVCTVPAGSPPGTEEFVLAQGVLTIPWASALRHRFDLVVAASRQCVDQVSGPVVVLPHGAGAAKSRRLNGHGLDRASLTRGGRVVPAAILLAHDDELALLADACPEAVPRAVVAGDLCLDRLRASLPRRAEYRAAAGVGPSELLVTISSTWSPRSTFGSRISLYRAVSRECRAAAVLGWRTVPGSSWYHRRKAGGRWWSRATLSSGTTVPSRSSPQPSGCRSCSPRRHRCGRAAWPICWPGRRRGSTSADLLSRRRSGCR